MIIRSLVVGLAAGLLAGCLSRADASCPILDPAVRQLAGGCDDAALIAAGRRYEAGDGVPQDYRQAAALYRAAASAQPAVTYVYSPPVGSESAGRVIPVRTGSGKAPSPEAQYRLALLYLKGAGLKQDEGKARRLMEQSAKAGFAPAVEALSRM